jgi:hypothetical protein
MERASPESRTLAHSCIIDDEIALSIVGIKAIYSFS